MVSKKIPTLKFLPHLETWLAGLYFPVGLSITSSRSLLYHYFWLSHIFIGDSWDGSWFHKDFNVVFFSSSFFVQALLKWGFWHTWKIWVCVMISVRQAPQREAGDVWCLPPVWNLRAVIWFHFAVSSLVLLPSPVTFLSYLFLPAGPFF